MMFTPNTVYLATDGIKTAYICVDNKLDAATVDYFMQHTDTTFICIERALDSTKKFNLKIKWETSSSHSKLMNSDNHSVDLMEILNMTYNKI